MKNEFLVNLTFKIRGYIKTIKIPQEKIERILLKENGGFKNV